jgi:hypothetical protein
MKQDIRAAKKIRLPWWGTLCAIIGSGLSAALFDHYGRLELALPVLNGIVVIAYLLAVKWGLRRRPWFWATMLIVVGLHVPVILLIPWTTKWVPAATIAVIDSVDFYLILAILSVVGNFMEERSAATG